MTALQCENPSCRQFWTVHTLNPDTDNISHRLCPTCIAGALRRIQ